MLQQVKNLQGAATLTGQIQNEVSANKRVTQTSTECIVPPIATSDMRAGGSTQSFERHIQVSKTSQGASKMFNQNE